MDVAPSPGLIGGQIRVGKATDESDVLSYTVYFGSGPTQKLYLSPIVEIPASGADVAYHLTEGTVIPVGATHLLAFSRNAGGEDATGVAVPLHDATIHWADASAGQGPGSGLNPRIAIDSAAGKVLVVTNNAPNGSAPALFRCALDGTGCTYADISAGQSGLGQSTPAVLVDAAGGKLLVVTQTQNGTAGLLRCALDGTGCAFTDLAAAQGQEAHTSHNPSAAIDAANGKLLVAAENAANGGTPVVYVCNLDGSGCLFNDVSAGQGGSSGTRPSIVVDAAASKLLVVTDNGAASDKPGIFRCDLDATNCQFVDLPNAVGGSGSMPSAAVDVEGGALVFATMDVSNGSRTLFFRCALDGSACVHTDISVGQGTGSGVNPSLVVDAVNRKVLVVTQNGSAGNAPALFRCNLDGSACVFVDFSGPQGNGSGFFSSATVDPATGELFVAAMGAGAKPGLFFLQ
ncbi:hypothetical protein A7982_13973 [Minicystis rosea]|nr:hypothetical protein A7982_13973 [Minicystis rosea]